MRMLLAILAIAALAAAAAHAQEAGGGGIGGGMGGGGHRGRGAAQGAQQKVDPQKQKAIDDAYRSAVSRIPDSKEKYDPWKSAR